MKRYNTQNSRNKIPLSGVVILLSLLIGFAIIILMNSRLFLFFAPVPVVTPTPDKSYFVDSGLGLDTNLGFQAQPWKTIQKCIDSVHPGDTCKILSGTYDEALILKTSGTAEGPIMLKCVYRRECIVNSGGLKTLATKGQIHHYIIEGFKFIANYNPSDQIDTSINLQFQEGNDNFILRDNYIEGAVTVLGRDNLVESNELNGKGLWSNGIIDWYGASHDNIHRNNIIHDYTKRGIWLGQKTDNILIEGNTIFDVGHFGVDCDGAGSLINRCRVRNNIIYNVDIGIMMENAFESDVTGNVVHDLRENGMLIKSYGIGPDFEADKEYRNIPTNLLVQNNLFYNGAEAGIIIEGSPGGRLINNTIYYSQRDTGYQGGVSLTTYGTFYSRDWEIKNNIIARRNIAITFHSPDSAAYFTSDYNLYFEDAEFAQKIGDVHYIKTPDQWRAMSLDIHGIFANPLFVDVAAGNYHLLPNSPACTGGENSTYIGAFPCQ
jgi:parallel beta-helix repeat protein